MPYGANLVVPPDITFFVDRSLGGKVVPSAIRPLLDGATEKLAVHDELFDQDTDDETWLEHVGRQQWVCFSKDERIGRNALELAAIVRYRVRIFMFVRQDVSGAVMGAAFGGALPHIRKILAKHAAPLICTVQHDGSVRVRMRERELVDLLKRRGYSV